MAKIDVSRFLSETTDSVQAFEATGLVPAVYDYVALVYDGSNRIVGVTYKAGGAGGVTAATLAITYVGVTDRIATVTRT